MSCNANQRQQQEERVLIEVLEGALAIRQCPLILTTTSQKRKDYEKVLNLAAHKNPLTKSDYNVPKPGPLSGYSHLAVRVQLEISNSYQSSNEINIQVEQRITGVGHWSKAKAFLSQTCM